MIKHFSLTALFISFLLILVFASYYPKWQEQGNEATISYDVSGYYLYLPALFIYKDIHHFEFTNHISEKYHTTPQAAYQLPNGNYFIKYSVGAAVCYSPFFFLAHGIASVTSYPADGYSFPYQVMLGLGCLFYSFIGLMLLRKILLQYFNEMTSGITLLLLVAATNYLNYAAIDQAMTHSILFTIYACIIWFTIKFYKNPSIKFALFLGFFCGLATIIRPSEIISILIPIGWGLASKEAIQIRFKLFLRSPKYILAFVLTVVVIGSLQLFYWKIATGHFIYYSYQNEGFDWLHPHFMQALFSYRKGWFIYTPFMILICPGFYYLYKLKKELFFTIFVFTILNTFIIVSWWCWWYGGSLGQRSMVQSYLILSIPIAALVNSVLRGGMWKKSFFTIFAAFCCWYNINLTIKAHNDNGIFESEYMNRTYFLQTFGKLHVPWDTKKYLDTDERFKGERKQIKLIYSNDIEQDTLHIDPNSRIGGRNSLFVNKENQYTTPYSIPIPPAGSEWIRVSADFTFQFKEWNVWNMTQFIVQFKQDDQVIKYKFIRIQRIIQEKEIKRIDFDIKIPEEKFNKIEFYLWNGDSQLPVFMDNITVESFK